MEQGKKLFRATLIGLTCLSLINLLFTASIVSLIGSLLILAVLFALKKGEYELRGALSVILFLHVGVNGFGLITAVIAFITDAEISPISALWLLLHTVALLLFALLLRSEPLKAYLKEAPRPEKKEKKITFFHGGWRDL